MEAEAVLTLYDSLWFHPTPKTPPSPNPNSQIQQPVRVSRIRTRSKSEDLNLASDMIPSPDSVIPKPLSLQTILSQKEFTPEIPKSNNYASNGLSKTRRKKKAVSKSLSELEFEELKGFMDLGFVFCEEDKGDLHLVEIIPGLQRLGQKPEHEEEEERHVVRRPYLSEAWDENNGEEDLEKRVLMEWRIPQVKNDVDMKDSLKWWAHTVASAVR